jgi:hypothetical protein
MQGPVPQPLAHRLPNGAGIVRGVEGGCTSLMVVTATEQIKNCLHKGGSQADLTLAPKQFTSETWLSHAAHQTWRQNRS